MINDISTWSHRMFDGTVTQSAGSFILLLFLGSIAAWIVYRLVAWTVRDVADSIPGAIRSAWRAVVGRKLPPTCIGLRHGCRCVECVREMDVRR